jgi:hypothetical protein
LGPAAIAVLSSLVSGRAQRLKLPLAAGLFLALFVTYNANGREIGGSDSQPTKFGARALALRGNLWLDDDVARLPQLAERNSFARDLQGHWRSAYSPAGSISGGVVAVMMRATGADLNAPRGANLIAVLTASVTVAAAVCLVFLTLARFASLQISLIVAIGLGLGTNYWAMHSQTLAQHDLVAFGTALTLWSWTRPTDGLIRRHLWVGALGLGIALLGRTQVAPLAGILGLGLIARVGLSRALGPLLLIGVMLGTLLIYQWHWFGHPLGAMPLLESLHPEVHNVAGSLSSEPWIGAAGLLISPNRGLLIYSPVVILALLGIAATRRSLPDWGLGWGHLGCLVLYLAYSCYTVWWGGHSYGPRYLLDFIVFLAPAAAIQLTHMRARSARLLATFALLWSIVVAGTGAFFADNWNTFPASVDRNHERLWDWRDAQIPRAWQQGLSPQNFNLFEWCSARQVPCSGQ